MGVRRIWQDEESSHFGPVQLGRSDLRDICGLLQSAPDNGLKIIADGYVAETVEDLTDLGGGRVRHLELRCQRPWVVMILSGDHVDIFGDSEDQDAVELVRKLSGRLRSRRRRGAAFVTRLEPLWYGLFTLVGLILFLYTTMGEATQRTAGFKAAVVVVSTLSLLGGIGVYTSAWIRRRSMSVVFTSSTAAQTFLQRNGEAIAVGSILAVVSAIVSLGFSAIQ